MAPISLLVPAVTVSTLLATLAPAVTGHALWLTPNPEPRHDNDNWLKAYPCGTNGQFNNWTAPFTELAPGRQTLRFRETINHPGSPYRVAFTWGDDTKYDRFVVLDHIPHNDKGRTDEHTGEHRGKWHEIDVDVPDVDCTKADCALQIVQIMSDKFPQGFECQPEELAKSCGNPAWAYFSCANVRITGSANPEGLAPFYRSYDGNTAPTPWRKGESGEWCEADGEEKIWHLCAQRKQQK
eukprot:TRINITY_DN2019_c0_g1_i2.p3 TRINITY_DN2019_c0_g1~~TRINITY_DN2019_c0_g1_i2.p3  ORF type:complete len:258 (-),score=52.29 TRINITY_DN2019_c0_g1_i2:311-1027(-)